MKDSVGKSCFTVQLCLFPEIFNRKYLYLTMTHFFPFDCVRKFLKKLFLNLLNVCRQVSTFHEKKLKIKRKKKIK